jgi:hypothetical protein
MKITSAPDPSKLSMPRVSPSPERINTAGAYQHLQSVGSASLRAARGHDNLGLVCQRHKSAQMITQPGCSRRSREHPGSSARHHRRRR